MIGELAALATSLLWALTSIFFTLAGTRVGSRIVNRVRLPMAAFLLGLFHLVIEGVYLPTNATPTQWFWLTLSALVGLVLGDGLLFYAFTQIGARLSMLLMALNPIIGTLLAWAILGERLSSVEIAAIIITIAGVSWVVLERTAAPPGQDSSVQHRNYIIGVLAGLGGATGQATGLVFSKMGMTGHLPPHSASLIRLLTASIIIWLATLARGEARRTVKAVRDQRSLIFIVGGALVGPTLGMTLSLVAVQFSEVGLASTLMALSPIMLLPLSHWIFGERISNRAIWGTIIAILGVSIIFLW